MCLELAHCIIEAFFRQVVRETIKLSKLLHSFFEENLASEFALSLHQVLIGSFSSDPCILKLDPSLGNNGL